MEDNETRREYIIREERLTRPQKLSLEQERTRPGAEYVEVSWTKTALENILEIERAVDALTGRRRSATATATTTTTGRPGRGTSITTDDLPAGLRTRITDAVGPVTTVQLVYSTKTHHVCRVTQRTADRTDTLILLVGPNTVRRVESVEAAVDALIQKGRPSSVRIGRTMMDAPGHDTGRGLGGEWIEVVNQGSSTVDLTGWVLSDKAGHKYAFPDGTKLARGASVRVRTGEGRDTEKDLYWGRRAAVWNNEGDTAYIHDAGGRLVDTKTWVPPALRITRTQFDVPGRKDKGRALEDEWVELTNATGHALELTGWELSDKAGHTYEFPKGFTVRAGASVRVCTGIGKDTDTALYWGRRAAVWNNDGDTAYVRDAGGKLIDARTWP